MTHSSLAPKHTNSHTQYTADTEEERQHSPLSNLYHIWFRVRVSVVNRLQYEALYAIHRLRHKAFWVWPYRLRTGSRVKGQRLEADGQRCTDKAVHSSTVLTAEEDRRCGWSRTADEP